MRTVEVSRFVAAPPAAVGNAVTAESLVAFEGTFSVRDVEEREGEWLVAASARGLDASFRVTETDAGWRVEQAGGAGPFETLTTEVSWRAENEGARVTATSTVSLGLPIAAVTDRIAAWKRRGELERFLDALADAV
ncbi:SRPBCC family protein [Halocalculus aciditolerans]|uniref:Polyketide cyclase / dehydrase and lipid transport n=1 Tax=Halocalculus aciditolerans TaxID=1383812 RepID=A0A830F7N9_9EURY|nr:SRPBCC family protein [Halocalculus aciditolerans]GGL47973.1 hypothetical protein GCM10009039_02710 [Halocalculus aciditolerans]